MNQHGAAAIDLTAVAGQRCVVLGGGGFVGTNLLRRLEQLGARSISIGRPPAFPEAVRDVEWRLLADGDLVPHARALREADVVFHLLGGLTPAASARDPVVSLDSSVRLTLEMMRARTGKIVFSSSGGTVYGRTSERPAIESDPTDPISFYGVEKLAIEKYLAADEHTTGRPFAALRIANPFGPFQHPNRGQGVVAAMAGRLLRGESVEIWGDGLIVRDFIFIDDVVEAMIASALYCGPARIMNVGSSVGRSVLSVMADLQRLAGLEARPAHFRKGRLADVPVNILDCERAHRELGWKPTIEWHTGLSRTLDWLRSSI
ncbi:MAG: NAD-dependent epimerase/dehydratase family protein [Aurantimonas endophytica]|uniref:NAD-dependent epimerase/dehydratase family protein n=1 Tax=Aurantimonas endophytica TaxID=1522175 RepID=UPI003001653A